MSYPLHSLVRSLDSVNSGNTESIQSISNLAQQLETQGLEDPVFSKSTNKKVLMFITYKGVRWAVKMEPTFFGMQARVEYPENIDVPRSQMTEEKLLKERHHKSHRHSINKILHEVFTL